ncbi:MAG: hypothetical protein ACYSOW_10065 [Planctomycetota bacterium]
MNKKIVIPITLIFALITCIFVPIGYRMLVSSTKYCHEASAWGALDRSIMLELDDYYDENGKYPDSLRELNIEFSDGATLDMLNQIQYQSNETSCQYSYNRHAGKWDTSIKTHVEITFTEGGNETYTATTPQ